MRFVQSLFRQNLRQPGWDTYRRTGAEHRASILRAYIRSRDLTVLRELRLAPSLRYTWSAFVAEHSTVSAFDGSFLTSPPSLTLSEQSLSQSSLIFFTLKQTSFPYSSRNLSSFSPHCNVSFFFSSSLSVLTKQLQKATATTSCLSVRLSFYMNRKSPTVRIFLKFHSWYIS